MTRMLFEIDDQTGEMTKEEIVAAEYLASELLEVIAEEAETPTQAAQAISAVISFVLSESALSREHANNIMKSIVMSVFSTIDQAEKDFQVNWNQRSKH